MTANILFERIYHQQKILCGTHWLLLHNPMKLTSYEVQKEMIETRFIDHKTLAIRFASKDEARRQSHLYFRRTMNKGGTINDLLRRSKKEDVVKIIASLATFFPFPISGNTTLLELTYE